MLEVFENNFCFKKKPKGKRQIANDRTSVFVVRTTLVRTRMGFVTFRLPKTLNHDGERIKGGGTVVVAYGTGG
ncbi:hypothetical protein V6Z11_A10G154700 [Gossypium hirsutum]